MNRMLCKMRGVDLSPKGNMISEMHRGITLLEHRLNYKTVFYSQPAYCASPSFFTPSDP